MEVATWLLWIPRSRLGCELRIIQYKLEFNVNDASLSDEYDCYENFHNIATTFNVTYFSAGPHSTRMIPVDMKHL